jgi:probable F420-dependent oxidoreductase
MRFGVCVPNYGETLTADSLSQVALEAESLGYDSIWTTDHVLMPRNSGTPYERIFDSISTLCYLAGQTTKVKLGISSLIIAMRNPVVVAKQLASLDHFSNGRALLAIGTGWNEKEFSNLGSDYHRRGRRVDESIELIRALWNGGTSFHGRKFAFDDAVFQPKPVSEKLEIWIGGTSGAAMKRATNLGDAWHPNAMPLDAFRKAVSDFRKLAPGSTPIRVRIGLNVKARYSEYTGPQGDKRIILSGDMGINGEIIGELQSLGVDYCLLVPNYDGKIEAERQIESMRAFANSFLSS